MLDQLVARQRWQNVCLTLLAQPLSLLISLRRSPVHGRAGHDRPSPCWEPANSMTVEQGLPPSVTWCSSDTRTADPAAGPPWGTRFSRCAAPPPRSSAQPGHMFHAESFWPTCSTNPRFGLPFAPGDRPPDRHSGHPPGQWQRLHPKRPRWPRNSSPGAGQPDVHLRVIGHANGADGRRSRAFYRKTSERRAESLITSCEAGRVR